MRLNKIDTQYLIGEEFEIDRSEWIPGEPCICDERARELCREANVPLRRTVYMTRFNFVGSSFRVKVVNTDYKE